MKFHSKLGITKILPVLFAAIGTMAAAPQLAAQPANRPLLTNQAGALPNLMISLDNSGSMAFNYHESYNVTDDTEYEKRLCPTPYSNRNSATLTTFNSGIGGEAIYSAGPTYTCYERVRISGTWTAVARTGVSQPYVPAEYVANWSAQRSADVNPLYYNPRVRYLPRVNGSGTQIAPTDGAVWVSNQASAAFSYRLFQRNVSPFDLRVYHSMYASDGFTRNYQNVVNQDNPTGFTVRYSLGYTLRTPQHIAYASATASSPAFTYAICTTVVTDGSGLETGCSARTQVSVRYGDTASYTIPTPHTRTDCSGNVCTNTQEVTNIMNWFRWYSIRQTATSTAIGQALADVNTNGALNSPAKFDDKLRIGYMPINETWAAPLALPPGAGAPVTTSRGVRNLHRGSSENNELFSWLNGIISQGGTPLHYSIERAADYYLRRNNVTENPWRTIPTDANSAELSCRRSFNLLFSDGGWTSGGVWGPSAAGPDYDNTVGPAFSRTLSDGSTETFQYQPQGINTVAGRLQYTPYPSNPNSSGGLADLTAKYYWHTDMLSGNANNNVQTRPGQPTFWQNMATYTIGYLIQPGGEVAPTGLTFNQINTYQTKYALLGYTGAASFYPTWPSGDLIAAATTQPRVDDFIHAGYTGGARSFSARTADDVKGIFNTILSEILSASGRDAGVSVSSGGDSSTLAGQLKYTVSYKTLDNSGNILAKELDANGNETGVTRWSAEQLMVDPSLRRVFTMNSIRTPIDFLGNFTSLTSDVQTALKQGTGSARIPNDANFVNYLRGDNSATDANGQLFRQRASKIAAMVNPPSELMNYSRDYQYDSVTSGGGVDGWDSYKAFAGRKLGYPSSLFVATNGGVMHSFDSKTGVEQAAFMPRRSMARLLNYATEPYSFEYVLDGPISQNDIFNRGYASSMSLSTADQWRAWRHIGVGTGGRGQQLIYAVNSPIKTGATPNRIPDKQDFLWETGPDLINGADGNDVTVGYMVNPARSGQTEDVPTSTNTQRGRWIVAINNGHYNGVAGGEKAGLVVLDALTGDVIRTIPLPSGYSAGRGLSGVTLLRNYNLNHRVVAAYAGDANGHLWKFNLTGAPSDWRVEHNRPLFTVPGNRPIFGAPAWQPHDLKNPWSDGFMVVFATGMMLEEGDLDDLGSQAIYGIWDQQNVDGSMANNVTFTEVLPSELQQQRVEASTATVRSGVTYYGITDNAIDWNTQRGWYMSLENPHQTDTNLLAGERSIAEVQNVGTSVLITTTVLRRPASTEMCTVNDLPANYVYLLDARTASATRSRSFDVTGDTRLDPFAVAFMPSGGFTRGVSVTKFYSRADGTPLSSYTLPTPSNASDPYIDPEAVGRPMGIGADGEYEDPAKSGRSNCRNMRVAILGTETNSLRGGVSCPTTGWSRTQFQLTAPPSN